MADRALASPLEGAYTLAMRYALACIAAVCAVSTAAAADPCKAIPDRGPLPPYLSRGSPFTGPVSYVGDGDSLCVAIGPGPQNWVEVRLADFYAPELHEPGGPEAKRQLEQVTAGQTLHCIAEHRSYDRVVAQCAIGRVQIGDRLRGLGGREGGRGR